MSKNPITLANDAAQVELIKNLAHKDPIKAAQAQMAFAASVGPIIQQVINTARVISNLYTKLPFQEYGTPEIPLDLFYDIRETDYVRVWSQTSAGGLPTNEVHGTQVLKLSTYNLYSAVAFLKKFAAQGRVDIVARTLNKMAQEFLVKREFNAATVLLGALATAQSPNPSVPSIPQKQNVLRSVTQGTIVLDDFLALFNLAARIMSSWNGGTPDPIGSASLTDLIVSPEGIRQLRSMSFNPVNTRGTVTNIPATEQMRNDLYKSAGAMDFYGVNIMQANELGIGYNYNTLFASFAGATTYPGYNNGAAAVFTPTGEQLAIGINLGMDGLIRPVSTDSDTGSEVTVSPDGQYINRQEKIGFYAKVEESYAVVDARTLFGLIW